MTWGGACPPPLHPLRSSPSMKALYRLAWAGAVALVLSLPACKGSKALPGEPRDASDDAEAIPGPKAPGASGPFRAWMLESRDLAQGWLRDSGAPTPTART